MFLVTNSCYFHESYPNDILLAEFVFTVLSTCGFKPAKKDKLWRFLKNIVNKTANNDCNNAFLTTLVRRRKFVKFQCRKLLGTTNENYWVLLTYIDLTIFANYFFLPKCIFQGGEFFLLFFIFCTFQPQN